MLSPEQSRAARAWLDWSQEDLAQKAGVAPSTIRDFEKGRRVPIKNNLDAIEAAFRVEGITFERTSKGKHALGISAEERVTERALTLPILDYLDDQPDGFMLTSDLIAALELRFEPQGEDAEILNNRSDTKFSQIVRNTISHRTSPTNVIGAGYAEYDPNRHGLAITPQGREYLLQHQRT